MSNNDTELLLRYFQQYFCFFMSSQSQKAGQIVVEIKNIDTPSVKEFQNALLNLIEGTLAYRTSDMWSVEKFVLGETEHYRKEHELALKSAETKLLQAVKSFSEISITNKNNKAFKKLYSEALYRLGELYILLDEKPDKSGNLMFSKEVSEYIEDLKGKTAFLSELDQSINIKSCHYLLQAAQVAHSVGDKQRETDALQSVVNALYFNGLTIQTSFEVQENNILLLTKFNNFIRQELETEEKTKFTFPIVASKTFLVEGDLYFSWLFESIENDTSHSNIKFTLRIFNNELETNKKLEIAKSILHKMMLNYLESLNLLTDSKKKYENYHFNNMVLEINRRILLIEDKKFVKYMSDDLRPIWNTFSNLADKKDVLEALDYSLKIHELALTSKEIFDNKQC